MNLGDTLKIFIEADSSKLLSDLGQARVQVENFAKDIRKKVAGFSTTLSGTPLNLKGIDLAGKGEGMISSFAGVKAGLKTGFAEVQKNYEEIISKANQMSLTAMRTILAGGAAIAVAWFPTKEAAEFEKQMTLVGGVTNATAKQYEELSNMAVRMSRETVFSATQAAAAMTVLAKAGLTVSEVLKVLPSTLYLAAAGEMSVAEAADVAASALHGFHKNAEDFAHIADVIATSATYSSASVQSIADSFKYVAPAAHAAGMSIDETGAALAVLANAGIRGSMAGTTLRQILLRLTDDGGGFNEKLQQMGVQALDLSGKMRPFLDIMSDLNKRGVNITQIGSVFTARSASGAIALANSADELRRFAFENQNAAGEAKRLSDVVLNNLLGSIEYLKSSLSSASIIITKYFLAPLKLLIDMASGVVNAFTILADLPVLGAPIKLLGAAVLFLASTMGGLLLVMGGAGIILSGAMRAMAFLSDKIGYLSAGALKSKATMTALSLSMTPLGAAFSTLSGHVVRAAGALIYFFATFKLKDSLLLLGTSLAALTSWWMIATVAVLALGAAMYYFAGANARAVASSGKKLEEAVSSRKELENYTKTLQESAVGTGEHDRVLTELVKRYPELAGSLRLTNQSLQEQQDILNNFKTTLFRKELEASFDSLAKLTKHLDNLYAKQKAFQGMSEVDASAALPGEFGQVRTNQRVDDLKREKQVNDETRTTEAQARVRWQKWLDSINWDKLGKKPLDLIRSTQEEFQEVFSSQEESVRRIIDLMQAEGLTLKDQLNIREKITRLQREQLELELQKRGKPVVMSPEFTEAKTAMGNVAMKYNMDLAGLWANSVDPATGQKVNDLLRGPDPEVLGGVIGDMTTAAAMFGPQVTQVMAKDLNDLIEEFKKLNSSTENTTTQFINRLRTLAAKWNNIIADMKPLTEGLLGLGGTNWAELANKLNIPFDKLTTIMNSVNVLVGQSGGLLSQNIAASILMGKTGGGIPGMVAPITGTMSRSGGFYDTRDGGSRQHSSLDLAAPGGTPFVSPIKMQITGTKDKMSDAKGGIVFGLDDSGRVWKFVHVTPEIRSGMVEAGQRLGTITDMPGAHLHLQVKDKLGTSINLQEMADLKPGSKVVEKGPFGGEGAAQVSKFQDYLNRYKNEQDQLRKALAAMKMGTEAVPVGVPYSQIKITEEAKKYVEETLTNMQKYSKDVGFNLYGAQAAKEDKERAANTFQAVKIMQETGKMATPASLVSRRAALEQENAAAESEAAFRLAKLKESGSTDQYNMIKIREEQANLDNLKIRNQQKLAEFNKQASAEMAKLTEMEVKQIIEQAKNQIEIMEAAQKVLESQLETSRAMYESRVAGGTMTGTEAADAEGKKSNEIYQNQLAILGKRQELIALNYEQEKRAIEAKSQSQGIEVTNNALAELGLKTDKDRQIIATEIAAIQQKQATTQYQQLTNAIRLRQELIGTAVDFSSKLAWGPLQERSAQLLTNAKEITDLSKKLIAMPIPTKLGPEGLIKPLEADPSMVGLVKQMAEFATVTKLPWADELQRIVADLSGAMDPAKLAAVRDRLVYEIVPKLKLEMDFQTKWKETINQAASAITDGIQNIAEGIIEGTVDIKKAAHDMFKNLFQAGIKEPLKWLQQQLIAGFKEMFGKVGGGIASGVLAVVGIIGMLLTKPTSKSFSPSGVESGVTAHEAVRGVIAGETSIPIAEISVSLSEAVSPHLDVLRQIENNTRRGVVGGGGGGQIELIVKGLSQSIQEVLEQYFREYLVKGAA